MACARIQIAVFVFAISAIFGGATNTSNGSNMTNGSQNNSEPEVDVSSTTNAPTDAPTDAPPADAPTDAPPTDAPVTDSDTDSPTDAPTDAPSGGDNAEQAKSEVSGELTFGGIDLATAKTVKPAVAKGLASNFDGVEEADIVVEDPVEVNARRLSDGRRLSDKKIKFGYKMTVPTTVANTVSTLITAAAANSTALLAAIKTAVEQDFPDVDLAALTVEVSAPTVVEITSAGDESNATAAPTPASPVAEEGPDSGCRNLGTALAFVSVAWATLATFTGEEAWASLGF